MPAKLFDNELLIGNTAPVTVCIFFVLIQRIALQLNLSLSF